MSAMTVQRGCSACGWMSEPRAYAEGEEIVLDTAEHVCPTITIPRPHVPFGPEHVSPEKADAAYLRAAVRNVDHLGRGERLWGSNLTATVRKLLLDAAEALDPETHVAEEAGR